MRSVFIKTTVATILLLLASAAGAQSQPQVINIPLSQPGAPIVLDIDILSARIEVIGEDREDTEFTVSAQEGSQRIITPSGTKPVSVGVYSVEIEEEDNEISVDADWRAQRVEVTARIPQRADLELSTTNNGEIIVRNITGKLQMDNTNGAITATGIDGSVIAETVNEDINIVFSSIDTEDAMSMISLNGNLNLSLPEDVGVQLHIDSGQGEIYSDFEVDIQPSTPTVERIEEQDGVEIRIESTIIANINGGGPVIRMKTLNGDIGIRKSE